MQRSVWLMVAVLCMCLPLFASSAMAQPSPPSADLGDNAALKYWISFAAIPDVTDAQEAILAKQDASADGVPAIVESFSVSLDLMRRASEMRACNWGLFKDGPDTSLPHLGRARTLARVALLRARLRVAEGKGEDAVEDLLAVLRMSRHCAAGGLPIMMLVEYHIENTVVQAAAELLPAMGAGVIAKLSAGMEALPPRVGLREALLNERDDHVGWFLGRFKQDRIEGAAEIMKLLRAKAKDEDAPEALLNYPLLLKEPDEKTAAEMQAQFERIAQYLTQWAGMTDLPLEDFMRQVNDDIAEIQQHHPVWTVSLWAVDSLRLKVATHEARWAMLQAAIAIVQGGEEKVKEFPDPFGKGPFKLDSRKDGFTLMSALMNGDEPMTLRVGK